MRVLLSQNDGQIDRQRIIPACAGITFVPDCESIKSQDHPRVCGYYGIITDLILCPKGSSPRVRVLPILPAQIVIVGRIIPACAGITTVYKCFHSNLQDHPRVCGYYFDQVALHQLELGSSPRVRVLPKPYCQKLELIRIIPACAGITVKNPSY